MQAVKIITFLCLSLLLLGNQGCQGSQKDQREIPSHSPSQETTAEADTTTQELPAQGPPQIDSEDEILGISTPHTGDLDSMVAMKRIRVLVPYNRTFYFIDGTERRGLAFEAANHFEKYLNKQVDNKTGLPAVKVVFVPTTFDQIIPKLLKGEGDLAIAGITITPDRQRVVDFSEPTITGVREVVVSGSQADVPQTLTDLAGRAVYVHASSSYYQSLQKVSDSLEAAGHQAILIRTLDEHLATDDVLEMVHAGLIPLTVVEAYVAQNWAKVLDQLKVHDHLIVSSNNSQAWAFRRHSPQLKAVVDDFVRQNHKGSLMGNLIFNRYLKNTKYIKKALSPEDSKCFKATSELFQKYGEKFSLDWLLLAAQGYQESGLNQQARSAAGAVGIMQIKPTTAAGDPINITQVENIDNNIHAGAKYLRYLIDHYYQQEAMDQLNKGLFALASYNAGPARIRGLRNKAASQGLDPNQWFDHVEMVAAKEIGRETVQYVSNIYKYYTSYRLLKQYADLTHQDLIGNEKK